MQISDCYICILHFDSPSILPRSQYETDHDLPESIAVQIEDYQSEEQVITN